MIIAIVQNILLMLMLVVGIKELKPMLKWAFGKEEGGENEY